MRTVARRLPAPLRAALRRVAASAQRQLRPPAAGGLRPLSDVWGLDRGTPIDVHYLERFLSTYAADIRGRTLETGDARWSRRLGRGVTRADVLNLEEASGVTIVGDLATGRNIPRAAFDCIVLTNTLLLIYDVRAAIAHCRAALRPGGVLLAHFTGLVRSQVDPGGWGPPGWQGESDHWRFTSAGAHRLCAEAFGEDAVAVRTYGNVRSVTAALYGLAAEELTREELDHADPRYELLIGARAVRRT